MFEGSRVRFGSLLLKVLVGALFLWLVVSALIAVTWDLLGLVS